QEEEQGDEEGGEPLALPQPQRVLDDGAVDELDEQLDDALAAARHQLGAGGEHAHHDQHDGEHDQAHQLDSVELEPGPVEEDRVREELVQGRDVEERIALGVQRGAEVCGVQLDLPWSCGPAPLRRPWPSFSIGASPGAATVRTAMDDAGAFRVVDQWSSFPRYCTVISGRAPREA